MEYIPSSVATNQPEINTRRDTRSNLGTGYAEMSFEVEEKNDQSKMGNYKIENKQVTFLIMYK